MSKTRLLLGGIKSFLPARPAYTMASYPVDARYGYSVWMRHLSMLEAHGVRGPFRSVVELGPGNSVATGLCALYSGAEQYTGLDVLNHLAIDQAQRVCDEVAAFFAARESIPGNEQYANLRPMLSSLEFPAAAVESFAGAVLPSESRLNTVREEVAALAAGRRDGRSLRYVSPWTADAIPAGSADLVFSQAVLEEISHGERRSDLRDVLASIFRWLRPGGVTCHQIDLGMYGLDPWNIHWTWSDLTWKLVRGKRDNFVNRVPLSSYLSLAQDIGFEIVATTISAATGVADTLLSPRFRDLSPQDKSASGVHLILRRPR
jgi:SAM-dependent methyltransferase